MQWLPYLTRSWAQSPACGKALQHLNFDRALQYLSSRVASWRRHCKLSVDVTHPLALQAAGGKLGKTSYPMSSHAIMAAAKGATENGAIAMISATRASTMAGSPTKASATLLGRQSFGLMGGAGAWETAAGATDPIRVLLGLPAEEAEIVLQQFQDQVRLVQNRSAAATAGSIAAAELHQQRAVVSVHALPNVCIRSSCGLASGFSGVEQCLCLSKSRTKAVLWHHESVNIRGVLSLSCLLHTVCLPALCCRSPPGNGCHCTPVGSSQCGDLWRCRSVAFSPVML